MEQERTCPAELRYNALNEHFNRTAEWIRWGSYSVGLLPDNNKFIAFGWVGRLPKQRNSEGKIFAKYGLKFHISLPEHNPEMYKHGWDIVAEVLLHYQVGSFKIIRSGYKMSDDIGQEGKDITIYADADPHRTLKEWEIILQEITHGLAEAKIDPGYRSVGTADKPEKPISGSNYITWRYCDEDLERRGKVSPWPKDDPCLRIKVDCKLVQGEPRFLERQKASESGNSLKKGM